MNNKQILFRGFRPCENGDTTISIEGKVVRGEWVEGGYWLNDTATRQTPHIIDCDGNSIPVLHSTVGQYTGKTDKKGVKIFVGDIISANFRTPFTVEWDSEGCRFLGVQPNDGSRHFSTSNRYICYLSDTQKVIGTIFDVPTN